jgi:hypothetical protein
MARIDDDHVIHVHPSGVKRVEDALHEAESASSPADTVRWQQAAIRLLLKRVDDLEMAVGQQDAKATEAIRARGRLLVETR